MATKVKHHKRHTKKGMTMVGQHHRKAKHGKKHPGFKAVKKAIAEREGIPEENAGAILASSARKASAAAKKRNPRIAKVKGMDSDGDYDGDEG